MSHIAVALIVLLGGLAPAVGAATIETTDPVTVPAVAVAQLPDGRLVGASSTISVSVALGGSGLVFIDTRPLAQVDMQGSARLAARVASTLTGYAEDAHDFFFVMRSSSSIVGGPSAGAVMTMAAVVALKNAHRAPGEGVWAVDPGVAATGTVNPDGTIGPVGGLPEKAFAAREAGARLFLVPAGMGTYTRQVPGQPVVQDLNMSAFCREELGIACREVGRVIDLVKVATGHQLRPPAGDPPGTALYAESVGREAARMVGATAARLERLQEELDQSALDEAERAHVAGVLASADLPMASARDVLASERYYSATSFAFQAGRYAALAEGLLQYVGGGLALEVVDARIEAAARWVERARVAARATPVSGVNDVLAVGAAQERVTQAETLLAAAGAARNTSGSFDDVQDALDSAGFAIERSRTVLWWANLTRSFGSGPALGSPLDDIAREFLDATRETVEYVGLVANPASESMQEALRMLARAERDLARGFAAGALVETAQAQVFATSALEPADASPGRLAAARAEAADAIALARGSGAEPVLAVSLFEFGGDNEASPLGLQFYRQARVLAGLVTFLDAAAEPTPSVFVGRMQRLEAVGPTPSEALRTVAVGYFILGAALVGTITIVAHALGGRRRGA